MEPVASSPLESSEGSGSVSASLAVAAARRANDPIPPFSTACRLLRGVHCDATRCRSTSDHSNARS
eukprot:CAMPEP_0175956474 /NCGR_PEP_ID=MMETSP0108-20121206/33100_1 /TAXON_ID=195067 ORGANISM="Goniomonas pacifica, Strain CCMP1869" /NCGR_SAMPLE_ID=MMETSP0108 /ASSEMBLY_ACC=CAM_ASM_000204 /LENGTH=65 /DNA_ID=CAMNT_0017283497 /DNA_START=370 /DNA_END=567 /DNA_ORIENTATION=-